MDHSDTLNGSVRSTKIAPVPLSGPKTNVVGTDPAPDAGDHLVVMNSPGYIDWALLHGQPRLQWQGENVIDLGGGQYWGFIKDGKGQSQNVAHWTTSIKAMSGYTKTPTEAAPSLSDTFFRFNIPLIAYRVFKLNGGIGPRSGPV